MIRAALVGAVLVHPIWFLVCFLYGYQFGAKDPWSTPWMGLKFGWEGGCQGASNLVYGYLITFGVAPLIASVAGAALGVGALITFGMLFRNRRKSADGENAQPRAVSD